MIRFDVKTDNIRPQKSLAVIGAGYLQRPLVERAKEMGLRVICFAWNDGAVCKNICDVFRPISIVEKEKILDVCRKENIDGICSIASDVAAPTVAYVAEKMGLKGNSYESALKAHDKMDMRVAFSEHGIPCPKFWQVHSAGDIKEEERTFPLIVKPVDRSGSLGVTKVDSVEELGAAIENACGNSFRKTAIVEQFVDGLEVSVEFISYEGVHYPLTITDKVTNGAPHFVELAHHQPSKLPTEIKERLYSITRNALDALGVTNGASHTEYKITKNGDIFIIETGARMGGDFIGSDLVRLSTGYDFVRGVVEVALGTFETPVLSENNCSGVYFLCEETSEVLRYIGNKEKYPQIIACEMTDNELKNVTCSAERSGYFIYKDEKRFEIRHLFYKS